MPEFNKTERTHSLMVMMEVGRATLTEMATTLNLSQETMAVIRRSPLYEAEVNRMRAMLEATTVEAAGAAVDTYRKLMDNFAHGRKPVACSGDVTAHTAFQATKELLDRDEPKKSADSEERTLKIVFPPEVYARLDDARKALASEPRYTQRPAIPVQSVTSPDAFEAQAPDHWEGRA